MRPPSNFISWSHASPMGGRARKVGELTVNDCAHIRVERCRYGQGPFEVLCPGLPAPLRVNKHLIQQSGFSLMAVFQPRQHAA
jgi:hypothetical protein